MCLSHSTKFYNPYGQKKTNDISYEQFIKFLNRYKNALSVSLIGNGEPLLNKDFFKMIAYSSNKMNMKVCSSSNGILVKKFTNEIIESNLLHLNISINGHNSSEFHRLTGNSPELFEIICNNVKYLIQQKKQRNAKLKVAATFILDQLNFKYLKEMITLADNLGVDEIVFFQFLPVDIKGYTAKERCLYLDNMEVVPVFDQINTFPKKIRKKVTLPPLLERDMKNNKFCCTPFFNISINGKENIGGCCCQLLNFENNGSFSDKNAWNNEHFNDLRRRFLYSNSPLFEPCTWCYNNSRDNRNRNFFRYNLISIINDILSCLRSDKDME